MQAFKAHFASLDRWTNGVYNSSKCSQLAKESQEKMKDCLDKQPPPKSFIPADRKPDEILGEYMERKKDEWDEQDCFWQGLLQMRYAGEDRRIEAQCKRDLEVRRLRKAVEKLTKEKK
jgi:hypothetical protein